MTRTGDYKRDPGLMSTRRLQVTSNIDNFVHQKVQVLFLDRLETEMKLRSLKRTAFEMIMRKKLGRCLSGWYPTIVVPLSIIFALIFGAI
jgi:hypothetical protein